MGLLAHVYGPRKKNASLKRRACGVSASENVDRVGLGSIQIATGSGRQVEAKGVDPILAAHEHVATMHQGDGLDDRQPQSMIGATVAARGVDPVEAFEQPRKMLPGN